LVVQLLRREPSGPQPLLKRSTFRSHRGTLLVAGIQATEA
jgi:hypothetical protein